MSAVERWFGSGSVDRVAAAEERSVERLEIYEIHRAEDLAKEMIEARTLARAAEYGLSTEFGVIDWVRPHVAGDPFKSQIATERIMRMSRINNYRLEDVWSGPPRRRR